MENISIQLLKNVINNHFSQKEPWQVVTITTTTVLMSVWFFNVVCYGDGIVASSKKRFFKLVKQLPFVKRKIEAEMNKVSEEFEKSVDDINKVISYTKRLPASGLEINEIHTILEKNLGLGKYNWKEGYCSGSVYYHSPDLVELVAEVYRKTAYTNPLHADLFPGLCKMEAEIVKIVGELFHGNENTCGTVTSGGTESILMACKAYRDFARESRKIHFPEIVAPTTAHAAFDKAAQYFGLKVKYVKINPKTLQVDINAMEKAISSRTIMLVGSAPNFPYGTVDDICKIGKLGLKYNIPVHVDSCLGGFLTAFMEDAGYPIPPCDFRCAGVTSISVDTHKYGFTPKGSSVILYSDKKYRHHQYTVTTDWPGGVYGSPSISGSRAGGSIAVCWATLLSFGKEGYVKATKEIISTTKSIENELRYIKEIYIFGQPATSVIAIGSNVFDIYRLGSELTEKGWNLNVLQFPSGIHICVTHLHTKPGVAFKFTSDVRECIENIMKCPTEPVEGQMAMYGVAQKLPDREIVGDLTRRFIDSMFLTPRS